MSRRFGLNGATTGPADLLTDLQAAAEAGYQGLELRDTKIVQYLESGGSIYALRKQLADAGVEAISVNAIEKSTLAGGPARVEVLRRCRMLCEWAAGLDCPYVIAVPSFRAEAQSGTDIRAETISSLKELGEIGYRYGVRIGFEFLGFRDCSVNTLAFARDIVETLKHPSVGLVLDAFHFHIGGSTWGMLEGLDPERLFVVHLDDAEDHPPSQLTDANRLLPGDGVIPLRDLVRRLETLGYEGPYTIELFRPEYYEWNPVELAKEALHRMERLFE
jgi:2-keto-myo-inositol isomerase